MIAQGQVAELLRRGRGLLVRVQGDASRAIGILRQVDWVQSVEPSDGALLVQAPAERAAELTMLLAAQSIGVAEIRPHEERLEQFFLEVTRE